MLYQLGLISYHIIGGICGPLGTIMESLRPMWLAFYNSILK